MRATQNVEDLRLEKLNENHNQLDPSSFGKVKMLKVSLSDIEINAAYIQLMYESMQALDIPSDSTGKLYSAKEFADILDLATDDCEFGTFSKNTKEMIAGFDRFRTDMMFSPFWAFETWMKFIEKIAEIID